MSHQPPYSAKSLICNFYKLPAKKASDLPQDKAEMQAVLEQYCIPADQPFNMELAVKHYLPAALGIISCYEASQHVAALKNSGDDQGSFYTRLHSELPKWMESLCKAQLERDDFTETTTFNLYNDFHGRQLYEWLHDHQPDMHAAVN